MPTKHEAMRNPEKATQRFVSQATETYMELDALQVTHKFHLRERMCDALRPEHLSYPEVSYKWLC